MKTVFGGGSYELVIDALDSKSVRAKGLPADAEMVQVAGPMSDKQWQLLSGVLQERPKVGLRVYYSDADLEFLRHLAHLQKFTVNCSPELKDISGLRHLQNVRQLHVGDSLKKLDISPVAELKNLNSLSIFGPVKSLKPIAGQNELRSLYLSSVKIEPDDLLASMPKLAALDMTWIRTEDVAFLSHCPQLEYLEMSCMRKVADLSPIMELRNLRHLSIQHMSGIETLPPLREHHQLEQLHLGRTKRLRDVSELGYMPALKRILGWDMAEQQPEMFASLQESSSLEEVLVGFGSDRRNNALRNLLCLPDIKSWKLWPTVSLDGDVTWTTVPRD